MGKSPARHPTEIRFSPFSLICLFFIWVGVSALAFYVGILVGRMEQMREIRKVYRADESAATEEELPSLSFEESLTAPEEGEREVHAPVAAESRLPEPAAPASGRAEAAGGAVLQIASFREPEYAAQLVRKLSKRGYPCYQVGAGADGGYCKVFVGPLSSKEKAVELKERLEQQEGYKGILIRSVGEKEGVQ